MDINSVYAKRQKSTKANVAKAKLCFTNIQGAKYQPGYLVVERQISKEKVNSPLRKLSEFTNIIVEESYLNESNNTSTIYVSAVAMGKENMQKLYEWIKTYADIKKVDEIAPGLCESLNINNPEDSVASRFAKYRKLYEEEGMTEDDEADNGGMDDITEKEEEENTDKEEEKKDDKEDNKEETDDNEEDEQEELTAIIIEVAKGDEDKAKEEMIEAGVDEDDIEILSPDEEEEDEDEKKEEGEEQNEDEEEENPEGEDENEDEGEETVKIKVSVDSFDALKEYLEGKGFNLEEELGGEIVSGDDEEEDKSKEGEEGGDEEEGGDPFAGFDDLFPADEEE